ncbi:hypothetical protein J4Q44_G00109360 [Coregonus suidteri]|uniref:Uncharacterized protein n=1 Tax=Coregonus suidteri TaxID=861788 RepID=A0AAN8LW33_9TELE
MHFEEVALEFTRRVSVDLKKSFYEGLDGHLPKILEFYRTKRCGGTEELKHLMDSLDKESIKTPRAVLRVKNAQARMAKPAEPAPTPGLYMERSQSRISLSASFEALAIYFPCMNSFDEDDVDAEGRRLKGIQRSTETGLAVEMPSRNVRQASHESIEDSMNSYGSEGK